MKVSKERQAEINAKRLKTMMDKYGVSNPSQLADYREKYTQTSLINHGTEYPTQSKEVKDKIRDSVIQTNLERYGVTSTTQIPEIRAKQVETLISHYGVENPMDDPELRQISSERRDEAIQDKYGVSNITNLPEFAQKANEGKQKTLLEKYGVTSVSQIPEVKQRQVATFVETMVDTYGVKHPYQIERIRQKAIKKLRSGKINKPEQLILSLFSDKLQYNPLGTGSFIQIGRKRRFPDFFVLPIESKKIVEHLGSYWHGEKRLKVSPEKHAESLINEYKSVGYNCLIIWEDELKNLEEVKIKIQNFISKP
jgi:hypothetical protein